MYLSNYLSGKIFCCTQSYLNNLPASIESVYIHPTKHYPDSLIPNLRKRLKARLKGGKNQFHHLAKDTAR